MIDRHDTMGDNIALDIFLYLCHSHGTSRTIRLLKSSENGQHHCRPHCRWHDDTIPWKTGYGQYTTALAFLQFFGIIVDFGLYIVLIKRLGEHREEDEEHLVNNIFTLRLISAIILLGLAPVIAWIFLTIRQLFKEALWVGSLMFLFVTLNQLLTGVFQKHLQVYWMSLAEIIGRFVLLGAIWWIIAAQKIYCGLLERSSFRMQ